MKTFALAFVFWLLAVSAHAATLIWDGTNLGPLTIERSDTTTGQFTPIATVPDGTTQYILTPGLWGHYRVSNAVGVSNTVQFSADLYAGPILDATDRFGDGRTPAASTGPGQHLYDHAHRRDAYAHCL